MAISRATIVTGPGTVSLGTPVFYDKDNIEAVVEKELFEVQTSMHGAVDQRVKDIIAKITFTPAGEVAAADLAALYPYATPDIGAEIFGSTDTASIIHSKAGKTVTFHSAALTKMPDLILAGTKTAFGQAEITAILKNNVERSAANSLYTIATTAFSDTSFATANVITKPYTAAWSTILTSIIPLDGFQVTFDASFTPIVTDGLGTIGMRLQGVTAMAKCRPINISESDILDAMRLQDTGAGIGVSERRAANLVISGTGGMTVTLYDAVLRTGPLRWGATEIRAGEIAFIAQRVESTGSFGALFAVAAPA